MKFFIAQIIGLIVTAISLGSVQFKSIKVILAGRFLANFLSSISCALLGGLSGAWICLLASFHTLAIYFSEKNKGKISLGFAFTYIAGTFVTYQGWADIVVCICSMLFTLMVYQNDSAKMRTVMGLNMILWLVYDLAIGAYANVLTHGATLISVITAKIRLDKKN